MNFIVTLILVSFLAFFGQLIGELLSRISPEEMKPGKKYFKFFYILFLSTIIILGLTLFKINFLFLFSGIILGLLLRRVYFYLAGLIFSGTYLFLFSIMIFVFGLFYGTINRFKIKRFISDLILFFATLFILTFFKIELVSFFIGGIITQVYFFIRKNYI